MTDENPTTNSTGPDAGTGTGTDRDTAQRRPLGRMLLGVLVCLLPLLLVSLTPLRADTALVYIGVLPAFVALPLGAVVSIWTAVATGGVVFVGVLLSENPIGAALFMVVLAVAVGWAHTRGWRSPATYVATQAGLAVIATPVADVDGAMRSAGSTANAALVAAVVVAAGIWVAIAGGLILAPISKPARRHPWDRDVIVFVGTLAVLLGTATYVIMRSTSGGNAWWILLTILVTVSPGRESVSRAIHRAGGTVLGGAVAAVLVVGTDNATALTAVGVVAAFGSALAYVRAPYWVFATTLTLALVLLTFPAGRVLHGDLERVAYTLLAAVIVVAVTLATRRIGGLIDGRATPAA